MEQESNPDRLHLDYAALKKLIGGASVVLIMVRFDRIKFEFSANLLREKGLSARFLVLCLIP